MIRRSTSIAILALIFACSTSTVTAQSDPGRVSITVAPTLVELGMEPGEIWRSSVKVVNTNTFPLSVRAGAAHFTAVGERGVSETIPVENIPAEEEVLARWITVEEPVVTIAPGASQQIPFRIEAPDDAAPGSHFAAIQVSTVPPPGSGQTGLQTAQVISSLLFVRVAGEISESANVRSFTATDSYGVEPATELTLRVENTGNVHLQPVGEISIKNMWGAERGRIPINYNTSFGNVLPESIREFTFRWRKEPSLLDIGYYTAEVSLAYGVSARQFLQSETGFWVIPVRPLSIAIGFLALMIVSIFTISRWYIRRLLQQAGVASVASLQTTYRPAAQPEATAARGSDLDLSGNTATETTTWQQRVRSGYTELRTWVIRRFQQAKLIWSYIPNSQRLVILGAGLLLLLLVWFFVTPSGRSGDFEAQVGMGTESITYNAEEITFFQQPGMSPDLFSTDTEYRIVIINESGTAGAAGLMAAALVDSFPVSELMAGTVTNRTATAIVFPTNLQAEALALNESLGGVLVSASGEAATAEITIYVGNDYSW